MPVRLEASLLCACLIGCSFSINREPTDAELEQQAKAAREAEVERQRLQREADLHVEEQEQRRLEEQERARNEQIKQRAEKLKAEEEARDRELAAAKKEEEEREQARRDVESARRDEERARLEARRLPSPPAVGTFEWSTANYGKGGGCEVWQSETLTVRIGDDGSASWSGLSSSQGRCSEGQFVPTTCGQDGVGFIERAEGALHLVTTERRRYGGGGTPSVANIWKCGSLQVHAPLDWTPSGSQRCFRLGSEPDPGVERASALVCQYADVFPELKDPGVEITLTKVGLSFLHAGRRIQMKPQKTAAAPSR